MDRSRRRWVRCWCSPPRHAPPTRCSTSATASAWAPRPALARELGGSANVHGDSRIGRPSPEGLRVLRQTVSPSDEIVVFDLGTNDDPAQPGRLAADLAAARRATGDRCLVVATLNRPPLNGVPVDGLNSAVLAFAGVGQERPAGRLERDRLLGARPARPRPRPPDAAGLRAAGAALRGGDRRLWLEAGRRPSRRWRRRTGPRRSASSASRGAW